MNIDLEELKRLASLRTPGRLWVESVPCSYMEGATVRLIKYDWDDVPTWLAESSVRANSQNDFNYFVAAANALPELVAEVERLRACNPALSATPDEDGMVFINREELSDVFKNNIRLRTALADAIRRPMGVIPDSAEGLLTADELDAAERRRTVG